MRFWKNVQIAFELWTLKAISKKNINAREYIITCTCSIWNNGHFFLTGHKCISLKQIAAYYMKQNLQGLRTFQPFNCQLFFTIFLPWKAGLLMPRWHGQQWFFFGGQWYTEIFNSGVGGGLQLTLLHWVWYVVNYSSRGGGLLSIWAMSKFWGLWCLINLERGSIWIAVHWGPHIFTGTALTK